MNKRFGLCGRRQRQVGTSTPLKYRFETHISQAPERFMFQDRSTRIAIALALSGVLSTAFFSVAPARADLLHDKTKIAQLASSPVPVCRLAAADLRKDQAFARVSKSDEHKARSALNVAHEIEKCSMRYESRGEVDMIEMTEDMWTDQCVLVRRFLNAPMDVPLPPPCNVVGV